MTPDDTYQPAVPAPDTAAPRRIGIVVFERCQIVDATGPSAVFGSANEVHLASGGGAPLYDLHLIAPRAGPVRSSSGASLFADAALSDAGAPLDTLICAGGKGTHRFAEDRRAIDHIRRLAGSARRVVSVCTGAYILAAAGLLDGKRAATHWAHCRDLADRFPKVRVEPEPIFVKDGHIYTSAGVTAGMDLALALLEEDHGKTLALNVAREMVMYMKRPGSQAQFSHQLSAQMASQGNIRDLQIWLLERLGEDISVETMADQAAMSLRTFNRRFKKETGQTPAIYVQEARVDAARNLLEESELPIKLIAAHCGFGDEERMRRAFHRKLGISPQDYRTRFASLFLP
jgi:transcriptional regulator GlxA family with amidase domain